LSPLTPAGALVLAFAIIYAVLNVVFDNDVIGYH